MDFTFMKFVSSKFYKHLISCSIHKLFGIRIQNTACNILKLEKALKSFEYRNFSSVKRFSQFLGNVALLNPFVALYSIPSSDPARRDWLEQQLIIMISACQACLLFKVFAECLLYNLTSPHRSQRLR